ncbi:hypothetical protein GCM10027031_03570 [Corynebacterium atrinae]
MNIIGLLTIVVLFGVPQIVGMAFAGNARRAWKARGLGIAGGVIIWFATMWTMLNGGEYHPLQIVACAIASITLVVWLTLKVSGKALVGAWATSFGLGIGFFITAVLPDETGQAAMGLFMLNAGTAAGLFLVALIARLPRQLRNVD